MYFWIVDSNKKQKIIVFVELTAADSSLIIHALKLSSVLKKELCLVFNYPSRQIKHCNEYKNRLDAYIEPIREKMPGQKVSSLTLSIPSKKLPGELAEKHEGILFVANSKRIGKFIKIMAYSPVPVVFVHPESEITDYNRIVLPVDLRKEIKDCSLWCSYFGRFNKAKIVVLAANDRARGNRYNVYKNIDFCKNLYKKLDITYKLFKGKKSSIGNVFEALGMALSSDCNLLVILGSSSITPLDLFVGLPEKKIVRKAGKLPVLVVNPQKDNYILCD